MLLSKDCEKSFLMRNPRFILPVTFSPPPDGRTGRKNVTLLPPKLSVASDRSQKLRIIQIVQFSARSTDRDPSNFIKMDETANEYQAYILVVSKSCPP